MKARLIGFVLVFTVLAALYVLTGNNGPASSPVPGPAVQPSSSDADFKNLKIQ